MQLTEKHRPQSLKAVVGQSDTVLALQLLVKRGLSSTGIYLHGASGTGKTTIANALLNDLGLDDRDIIRIGGADCLKESVQDVIASFNLCAWGETQWKAVIIDECHAMSERAVQCWLPYLETLPKRRLVIFTTTEAPAMDMFGQFTAPLLSRCKVFELKADVNAFAEHAAQVAQSENLNGRPIEEYRSLLASCGGNLRAALQRIEAGRMLRPFEAPQMPLASIPQAPRCEMRVDPIKAPKVKLLKSGSVQERIQNEIDFGTKFFAGSKKHKLHIARLNALKAEATNAH